MSEPPTVPPNEDLRQLEHFLPVGFALLMRYLSWPQALAMAAAAVVYGAFSARLWPGTRRQGEALGAPSPGKVWYGIAVFLLILLFPPFIVVAAWANLSVGDSVSNVVGRNFGRRTLPWNRSKTWLGAVAAFFASTLAAFVLITWTGLPGNLPIPAGAALWYAAATSLVCSVVETLPLPIDDNLAICVAGGVFLSWLTEATVPESFSARAMGEGVLLAAGLGAVALALRGVSRAGFASGAVIGSVVYYALGIRGFALLAAFFILGTLFTKIGYRRKAEMGAAQPDQSRRSARQVWGKGVAAFLAAAACIFLEDKTMAQLGFVAALSASLYDTTATELGLLAGGRPFLLTTLRRVAPGTRGAVSAAGSVSGLLAAVVIAGSGYRFGLVSAKGALWAAAAAAVATHVESWISARRAGAAASGPVMNAFHTLAALLIALGLKAGFG